MPKIAELVSVGFEPRKAARLCDDITTSRMVPPGVILPYGATAAPSGFLLCDGTAVSRTTYADLFAVIGTSFGVGDGSTTFNVPDFRQRYPMGKAAAGTGNTLGGTFGAIDHTHSVPAHYHSTLNAKESSVASGSSGDNIVSNNAGGTRSFASSNIGNVGSGVNGDAAMTSGTNNPPTLVCTFIIAY